MRQSAACIACGSDDMERIANVPDANAGTGRTYDYNRCRACGTTTLAQLLTPEQLQRIYPDDFYSYLPQVPASKLSGALNRMVYNRHRFRPQFGRMLEIGSGRGDFIASLNAQNNAVGLERSEAARRAGKDIGVDVVVGNVEDADLFEPDAFDYIYLNHAFEHLNEPHAALHSMYKWLKPGGRMFIGVPNIRGAAPRIFSKFWYHFAAPLHVTLYTSSGITALLERNGFVIERIDFNSDPLSFPISLFIAAGRYPVHMTRSEKLLMRALSVPVLPLSKALDKLGLGDCIEVHARRR